MSGTPILHEATLTDERIAVHVEPDRTGWCDSCGDYLLTAKGDCQVTARVFLPAYFDVYSYADGSQDRLRRQGGKEFSLCEKHARVLYTVVLGLLMEVAQS